MVFEKAFVFLCLIGALVSCRQNTDPEHIVDKAIEAHGGRLFENVQIEFDFRERSYSSHRQEGLYTYTRAFTDTAGQVKDILDNEGFKRFINGRLAQVSDERARAYSSSVNSTVYFALLPFGLDDPAVRGRIVWGGLVPYDQVWVTGAHMATNLQFDQALTIGGQSIPAGKYAFFTIPGKDEWTVILNKNWEQHLADKYDQKEDLVRVKVKPETVEQRQERLRYEINSLSENQGEIVVSWEKQRITLPVAAR